MGLVCGALIAGRARKGLGQPIRLGLPWLALGGIWIVLGRTRGPLLTDAGLGFLALGGALVLSGVLAALLQRGRSSTATTSGERAG